VALISDLTAKLVDMRTEDADQMRAIVASIQGQVQSPTPDFAQIEHSGHRLKEIAGKAENAAISSSVGAFVGALLKAFGPG
jgi:hypothetical protein